MTTRTIEKHDRARYKRGCRCRDCTAANTAYLEAYRKTRAGVLPHGTNNGYAGWGCRCDRCREAHRLANREQRGMV